MGSEPLNCGTGARFRPPVPIQDSHLLTDFASGHDSLDHWLKDHAVANEGRTSRTYVVEPADESVVVAYYALATGSLQRADLKAAMRHGLPDPVPAMVLGRLAVAGRHQGAGLGEGLLMDAMRRTVEVSRAAGVRMLVVHAIDEGAAGFYRKYGFQSLPREPLTLFMPIETIIGAL